MDLLDYQVGGGIEARYATVKELERAASKEDEPDIQKRLLTAARLREILETKEKKVVEALMGRLGASDLDDVSIVLEQTTQEIVESELAGGAMCA
jgi:hypothetical protein